MSDEVDLMQQALIHEITRLDDAATEAEASGVTDINVGQVRALPPGADIGPLLYHWRQNDPGPARRRLKGIRDVVLGHSRSSRGPWCAACGVEYPCPTIKDLHHAFCGGVT